MSTEAPRDFASRLDQAIADRRLSLSAIRQRLAQRGHRVSIATLSYWRSGKRRPEQSSTLDAIPVLEDVLNLPAGTLVDLIEGRADRTARRLVDINRLMNRAADTTAPVPDPRVRRVSTQLVVTVGPDRQVLASRLQRLIAATRDGVDSYITYSACDSSEDVDWTFPRAISGCRIARTTRLSSQLRLIELAFPRPLARDETWLCEVEFASAAGAPLDMDTDHSLASEQLMEDATIVVHFDPAATPQHCWLYFTEKGVSAEYEVDIRETSSVHHRQRDFGPGELGIRWEW